MTAAMSSRNHSPGNESLSSHGKGIGHTIVVKTVSSPSSDSVASSDASSPSEEIQTATTHTTSSAYPPSNGFDSSSHKRKRSEGEGEDEQRSSPHRQYDYSPPKRTEQTQHMADRALHVLHNGQPPQYYDNGNWHDQHSHSHSDSHSHSLSHSHSQPPSATSTQPNGVHHDQGWDVTTPTHGQSYEQDANGNVPKRKRNFANRTKTGCMTCRRRKKKCDEGRPHCNNCTRGGFSCEGYSTAKPPSGYWAPTTKAPILLQSKDGQSEESPASRPQKHISEGSRPYENGQTKPVATDEHDRPSHHFATTNVSEPRHSNRPHYPGQTWPQQSSIPSVAEGSHPSHAPSHAPGHSSSHTPAPTHVPTQPPTQTPSQPPTYTASQPPSQDMSRPPTQGTGASVPPSAAYHTPAPQAPQQYSTQAAPQPPAASTPTQGSYYTPPPQPEYRQYAPPPLPASEYARASAHSRMSSAYEPKRGGASKPFFAEDVERSKMNRQVPYNRLDPTLENDRKRCRRALSRYHAACEVDSGMDDEQARRMLEKVFDPARDESHNFKTLPDRRGTLSHKVKIESPFDCTYGYNLVMMDSVYIGPHTSIDDSAKVEIGPRTNIGSRVQIITSEPCKDLIDRKGSQGSWIAKEVYIGAGVIIGDGVMIYPDVRIENGVTIEPGAIVRESQPENAVLRAAASYRQGQGQQGFS